MKLLAVLLLIVVVFGVQGLVPITQYECNFDGGNLCRWEDISAGDNRWVVRTSLGGLLPEVDGAGHKSGYYAIIDTHMKWSEKPAVLATQYLQTTKTTCTLQLRYRNYVPTSYIATLKVIVEEPGNGAQREVLFVNTQHKDWSTITATIGQLPEASRVMVSGEGTTFQNDPPYADVDIDEIKFINC